MSSENKENVKKVKIKIVYDNFIDKYTKKIYNLGETEVTEHRLNEILDVEKSTGVKLIEIIDKEYLENKCNEDVTIDDDNSEDSNIEESNITNDESDVSEESDNDNPEDSESYDNEVTDNNKNSNNDAKNDVNANKKANKKGKSSASK